MPRKTLYTLNIGDYEPDICAITYPHLRAYARKIGAEFYVITERAFPRNDIEYEKLQIHELSRQRNDEWSIYVDSDALLHDELFDITAFLPKNTVMHWGLDRAEERWTLDEYFMRDGRFHSSCNWFAVASEWCRDLWLPPDDLTEAQIIERIHPIPRERAHGVSAKHLVTDYILSRNIARFGLKVEPFNAWSKKIGKEGVYAWHEYIIPVEEKLSRLRNVERGWNGEAEEEFRKPFTISEVETVR